MKKYQIAVLLFALIVVSVILNMYFPRPTSTSTIISELKEEQKNIENGEITEVVPEGFAQYQNKRYRFSLLYRKNLTVQEMDEGGGASTITFQDTNVGKGFQIFIVPYPEEQVSEERFRKDIPSEVIENMEEVVVNGAKGAAFYSVDIGLGETREVWFIKNGYLFELTTPKILEADLLEVLKTWKF